MVKIYTRTGDKGETSLYTGHRIPKDDPIIEAMGSVDECNCAIGAALSFLPNLHAFSAIRDQLTRIQHTLFDLGAALATPRTRAGKAKIERTRFDEHGTILLEQWIDEMEGKLPILKTFILPGGHPAGAMLHLARSIARRAERSILPINQHTDVSDDVLIYINRLSDYLFVASRYVNHLNHSPETLWHSDSTPKP